MKKYILFIILLGMTFAPAIAQDKLQTSMVGHHGEMDYVIDWKRLYSYDEYVEIMFDLQEKYPDLCSIESIGKSRMGRDQYVMTLTSKKTGKDTDKPALWMDGAIHGNEVNGITCCLYTTWYLLTRYDYDPQVHDILDRSTVYVLNMNNVDANDSYLTLPNTDNNPREPFRPTDDDGDGLYDEDMAEDVNGDGEISMIYAEDPKGDYRLNEKGTYFIEIGADDWWEGTRFRLVGSEGYDNDGDGQTGEDDLGGVDPNRNFPYDFTKTSGKTYNLSEPITRNVWMFQQAHKNILVSFNYHNYGRMLMFPMPPKADPNAPDPQVGYIGTEDDKYAFKGNHNVSPAYQTDYNVVNEITSDGLFIMKDYTVLEETYLQGEHEASIYHMLGAYAFLMELWGDQDDLADINNDGVISNEEYDQWIQLDLGGDGWVIPEPYDHPQFGEVWIGGTRKKHIDRNPPARYIEAEAMKNCMFVVHCLDELPKVSFGDYTVTHKGGDLYEVEVEVVNSKKFPTISDRSIQIDRYTPDVITASVSSGEIIEPMETKKITDVSTSLPAAYRFYNTDYKKETTNAGKEIEFRTEGLSNETFTYNILSSNPSATLELEFESLTGGSDKIEIKLSE